MAPGPSAVPWVTEANPGLCRCCGDPPSPQLEPRWISPGAAAGPSRSQREPFTIITAHPNCWRPPPRVPVTTKENISGWKLQEGRHGNTAAGFHQKPSIPPQKDTWVSARPGRHWGKTQRGWGGVSGTEGWSYLERRCPRGHPACPSWGWGHRVQRGHGDGGCCPVGAAQGRVTSAPGVMLQGGAGRGAGGAEGTLSWVRMGTSLCTGQSWLSRPDAEMAVAGWWGSRLGPGDGDTP